MTSRRRDIARILGKTETLDTVIATVPTTGALDSADVASIIQSEPGLSVYDSLGALPTTGLSAGDQAFVSSSSRLYLSNGAGWYNVALINATPTLSISPSGTIELSTEGTATVVTLTATDSDNADANLTLSVDSGGDFFKMATLSQDSSVFTITPRSLDSATTLGFDGSSTLTFKASDGISFGSATNTFTLAFSIANSQFTTLLVKADTAGNDNQVDASSSSHSITESGNVSSSAFTPYHSGGYSAYFDGTNDYMTVAASSDFDFGTGEFTVEWWQYWDGAPSNYGTAYDNNYASAPNLLLQTSNAERRYHVYLNGTSTTFLESSQAEIKTWHHYAVVRSGTTVTMYRNGTSTGSVTYAGAIGNSSSSVGIGGAPNWANANYPINGYFSNFRVVKGTAVYTGAFTPPTARLTAISGTSLLTCHLPYIADGSSNDQAITIAGNTSTARFSPYEISQQYTKSDHGGSVYFDGTDDYITVADSTDFDFGTGDFTMEGWYYATNVSGDRYILSFSTSSGNGHFGVNHYNGGWRVGLFNGSLITGTTGVQTNIWHHFAWVRASGVMKFYIDGAQVGSNVSYSSALDCSGTFRIGTYAVDATYGEYLGYLSDIRIVKGTAVYTSAFTPPTEPLTTITNTKLLTCTNKNSVYDASGTGRLTLSGGTTASNTQRKFATSSSFYLDGSDDVIYFLPTIPFGADDFTIEFWWYKTTTGRQALFFGTAGQQNSIAMTYGFPSGNTVQMYAGSNTVTWDMIEVDGNSPDTGQGTVELSHNAWNHIAMTRENSTFRLFVNGTLDLTVTGKTGAIAHYGNGTRYAIIGQWYQAGMPQGQAQGYFQNFRITNGLARYTSSFTPSTEEFKG